MLRGIMRLRFRFFFSVLLAGVALVAFSGCGMSALRDKREDRDPMLRRARELRNAGNMEGAADAYQRALDRRPQLARAHLELALVYDRDLNDYVRAVYHYERYLELRPNAENRDMIEAVLAQARLSYATTLPEMPNGAVKEIDRLRRENAALREAVNRSSGVAVPPPAPAPPISASAAPAAATPVAASAPAPAPASAAPSAVPARATTYVVKPGDTLARIAGKVYGDSKAWKQIYEANSALLRGGPQTLKVGQVLTIP